MIQFVRFSQADAQSRSFITHSNMIWIMNIARTRDINFIFYFTPFENTFGIAYLNFQGKIVKKLLIK